MEGALEDYNKALVADQDYADALYNRAFTLKFLGNYGQALRDAEQIVQLEPESPKHWNLKGNVHTLFGEYNEAIEAYSEAIYLERTYQEATFNRGLAYLMSYRPIQGCADLQTLVYDDYQPAEEAFESFCGKYGY